MKTMSSHLLKGMIIVIVLLVLAQAWRVSKNDEAAAVPEATVTQPAVDVGTPPSPRYQPRIPLRGSVEFTQELERAHNPWKDSADPDRMWHAQQQRASELMIRYNMPSLNR